MYLTLSNVRNSQQNVATIIHLSITFVREEIHLSKANHICWTLDAYQLIPKEHSCHPVNRLYCLPTSLKDGSTKQAQWDNFGKLIRKESIYCVYTAVWCTERCPLKFSSKCLSPWAEPMSWCPKCIPDICHKHYRRCLWRKNLPCGEIFSTLHMTNCQSEKCLHMVDLENNLSCGEV